MRRLTPETACEGYTDWEIWSTQHGQRRVRAADTREDVDIVLQELVDDGCTDIVVVESTVTKTIVGVTLPKRLV